jgi:N-acetylmuramoyl-L-alanine amidase
MQSEKEIEVLFIGSSGEQVENLQRKLKYLKLYLGPIDGLFGEGVKIAVKTFQRQQGLAADGIVGLSTLESLGFLYIERDSK